MVLKWDLLEKGGEGMKYNSKYDRWVTKDGLVYRYDKKKDRLIQCNLVEHSTGRYIVAVKGQKHGYERVHRLVWETFNSEIPKGYEIDHIDTDFRNNKLSNLRCVTHKENCNNKLTRKHISEAAKNRPKMSDEQKKKISESLKKWYKESKEAKNV